MRKVIRGDAPSAEPPRDVIENRLSIRDCRMACVARGLEARVDELVDQRLERHSVLQANRNRKRETVHEARERGAFLGHLDENFTWRFSVLVQADGDVALMTAYGELVRNGLALARQLLAVRVGEQFALLCHE